VQVVASVTFLHGAGCGTVELILLCTSAIAVAETAHGLHVVCVLHVCMIPLTSARRQSCFLFLLVQAMTVFFYPVLAFPLCRLNESS
jgi:hypothetical protein